MPTRNTRARRVRPLLAVAVSYMPYNTDGTSPGCWCEGWGVADAFTGLHGSANQDDGIYNVNVDSFTTDGVTSAVSTVTVSDPSIPDAKFQVVQDYHPTIVSPNLFE